MATGAAGEEGASAVAPTGPPPEPPLERRTAAAMIGDWLLFWTGDAFASQAVVLPLFVQRLSDSPLAIGMIPTIWGVGYFVPQLLAAAYAQRRPYKLRHGIALYGVQRVALLALAALTLLLAVDRPELLLVLFFVLFGLGAVGTGAGIPFHQDVVAKVLPVRARGRLRGVSLTVAGILGTVGGLAARGLLERLPYPSGFVLCFLVAGLLGVASLLCLGLIREPPGEVGGERPSLGRYLADLPRVVRGDPNFAWFVASRFVFALGMAAAPFLAVHATQAFALPASETGTLIAVHTAGWTVATALWGLLADRWGHKLVIQLGSLALVLSLALAAVAPTPAVAYAALALAGASNASYWVSGTLIVLEFAPPAERPTYLGLASTLIAPVSIAAPLLAGAVAAAVGYPMLFALALVPAAAGWLLVLLRVVEPRRAAAAAGGG